MPRSWLPTPCYIRLSLAGGVTGLSGGADGVSIGKCVGCGIARWGLMLQMIHHRTRRGGAGGAMSHRVHIAGTGHFGTFWDIDGRRKAGETDLIGGLVMARPEFAAILSRLDDVVDRMSRLPLGSRPTRQAFPNDFGPAGPSPNGCGIGSPAREAEASRTGRCTFPRAKSPSCCGITPASPAAPFCAGRKPRRKLRECQMPTAECRMKG